MIHPSASQVLNAMTGRSSENNTDLFRSISQSFLKYLDNVVRLVDPQKLLYIAVDGPAPRAKMNQQRDRRYKSAKMRGLSDAMFEKLNLIDHKSKFDTNAISPGTEFMHVLMQHIRTHYKKVATSSKFKVVLSSSNVPGEGEHKIMSEIRKKSKESDINCIYGLDADLIFLCLGVSEKFANMLLVREHIYFGDNRSVQENNEQLADSSRVDSSKKRPAHTSKDDDFDYLSIDLLREGIHRDSLDRTRCRFNKDKIIRDYIFICFLLGNDFLPHLPSLHISSGGLSDGLEIILRTYYSILRNSDKHLVMTDGTVNMTFFKKYLTILAGDEDKILMADNVKRQHFRFSKPYHYDDEKSPEVNRHDEFMHKQQIVYRSENDQVYYGNKGWKWRYWQRYFACDPWNRPKEYDEIRKAVALEYFRGLRWTKYYYDNDVVDWQWYYPYEAGPTLSDLVEFLDESKYNSIQQIKNKPFRPLEQLMMILPVQSQALLPKTYSNLMSAERSAISHLYPIDFKVNAARKLYYGECTARLPILNFTDLQAALKGLRLSAHEKQKNNLAKSDEVL